MSQKIETKPASDRELVICRILDASPEACYRAWTDPAIIPQWFCPRPWTIARVENDLRPGGSTLVVMRSPEGQEFPNPGVYLELVPGKKLVFTSAYTRAWEPAPRNEHVPHFTGVLTFEKEPGGKTRYTARALHWSAEDAQKHQAMGFEAGWGICADQLEETASKL